MPLDSPQAVKRSAKVGITWTTLIVIFAGLVGIIGRLFLGYDQTVYDGSLVFINMTRIIFPGVISGILLAAVLSASMSTADSQLLAAASAFASDVYQPVIRKEKASDKEMLWMGRLVVVVIAIVALFVAMAPGSGTIMDLVSNAWGVFGAAFGPAILLSLFWKRFNFAGAVSSIIVGAVVDILWLVCLSGTGIYEIVPGFIAALVVGIVVARCTKEPSPEVEDLFDRAMAYDD